MQATLPNLDAEPGEMLQSLAHHEIPEFDITAMVDLVFMMNIYFLVTFVTVALAEVNLPAADHAAPLDADGAVILTLSRGTGERPVIVYLGDGTKGEPLTDPETQEARIQAAVEQGAAEGKTAVLLKAERDVRLGDLHRISTAATTVEGMKLNVAVREKESP